ncbi:MAG: hypothetical protein LE169_00895 [Endomicrobium sp.]|nr:hypothetical protein [Endomicrobium sp.]
MQKLIGIIIFCCLPVGEIRYSFFSDKPSEFYGFRILDIFQYVILKGAYCKVVLRWIAYFQTVAFGWILDF